MNPMLFAAFFQNTLFIVCLLLISKHDLDGRKIPNRFLLVLILSWLVYTPDPGGILLKRSLFALALSLFVFLFAFLYQLLSGKKGLGAGDVKLIFALVLYIGFTKGLYMILIACVLSLFGRLCLRREKGRYFPFGPYLSLAALMLFFLP